MTPDQIDSLYAAGFNTARRLLPTSDAAFDDMVQEYVVKAWQAGQGKTDPVTYGKVAAGRHVSRVLQGRKPMLGSEHPGHRIHDQARQQGKRADLAETETTPSHDSVEGEVLARVGLADLVARLSQRDRVIAVGVAADLPWDRIGPGVGLAPVSAKNRWQRAVRPALREVA